MTTRKNFVLLAGALLTRAGLRAACFPLAAATPRASGLRQE